MTELQAENRDIDVIHEFTDFEDFTIAVEGAVLLELDFDIATEIRKDTDSGYAIITGIEEVRYWLITIH